MFGFKKSITIAPLIPVLLAGYIAAEISQTCMEETVALMQGGLDLSSVDLSTYGATNLPEGCITAQTDSTFSFDCDLNADNFIDLNAVKDFCSSNSGSMLYLSLGLDCALDLGETGGGNIDVNVRMSDFPLCMSSSCTDADKDNIKDLDVSSLLGESAAGLPESCSFDINVDNAGFSRSSGSVMLLLAVASFLYLSF